MKPTKTWRCRVCGYFHEGEYPPDICPVCRQPAKVFEEIAEPSVSAAPAGSGPSSPAPVPMIKGGDQTKNALMAMSYGLYIVSSISGERANAQTANTVFQISDDPVRLALGINKKNLTHGMIAESGVLAVTVLGKGNLGLVRRFGFQSGRKTDKFAGLETAKGPATGCPILPAGIAYLEGRVSPEHCVDLGSHTLFVAEIVGGGLLNPREPITYGFFRENRLKPEDVVDDVDRQNVSAALNLEYGANRRYQYEAEELGDPGLIRVLDGIRRNEGDHIRYMLDFLGRREETAAPGFRRSLLHMRSNLALEEAARDTYAKFAREAVDPGIKATFEEMTRAEAAHVKIFQDVIAEMESGERVVAFYCSVCGWEISFGKSPEEGREARCGRCGVNFRLKMGEWGWLAEQTD